MISGKKAAIIQISDTTSEIYIGVGNLCNILPSDKAVLRVWKAGCYPEYVYNCTKKLDCSGLPLVEKVAYVPYNVEFSSIGVDSENRFKFVFDKLFYELGYGRIDGQIEVCDFVMPVRFQYLKNARVISSNTLTLNNVCKIDRTAVCQ
jgi:hypothetical protein